MLIVECDGMQHISYSGPNIHLNLKFYQLVVKFLISSPNCYIIRVLVPKAQNEQVKGAGGRGPRTAGVTWWRGERTRGVV